MPKAIFYRAPRLGAGGAAADAAGRRGRSRHSQRCDAAGVHQARGRAFAPAGAGAAEGHARRRISAARPRLPGSGAGGRLARATEPWCGSPIHWKSTKATGACRRRASSEARVSLESDKSFASYDQALAHVSGDRLPDSLDVVWNQAMLDVLFEYPIQSDRSEFSIHPAVSHLGLRRGYGAAVPAARRRGSRVRVRGRPGPGAARSALAPGGAAVRASWVSSTFWTAPTTCCSCFAW